MDESPDNEKGQPGIVQAALSGLCPRCNAPTLFEAPARIALRCESCGLDFGHLERGARWAGLVTIIVAALLILSAIAVDVALRPPFWLQALVWGPVTISAVIFTLRFYKTALLYKQFEMQGDK